MTKESKKTNKTATQKPIEKRKTIKRYQISRKDCEAVESLNQPFCDPYDIYLYLQDRAEINLSRAVFLRIMGTEKDEDLTRLEQRFKYAVSDLITRTNYNIYRKLYEQADNNPDKIVDYLKLYDRREREQTAKTKAYRGKLKDDDKVGKIDNEIIERNMSQLTLLVGSAQPANEINIQPNQQATD